ncbi:MAG: DUF4236 domain-containing protein [Phascolarctobacterium sp.]|nr:DUF4236 domain-containing protein [Phascolarctobacterium sp.]MBR5589569.1 DUF4236 domain-containing protein [Phascolarctobacterium sp.]
MGFFRFRKSIKIAKGVNLNINKGSVGMSVGTKGMKASINSKGRVTKTVGIPGSGLSYTSVDNLGKKKSADANLDNYNMEDIEDMEMLEEEQQSYSAGTYKTTGRILQVLSSILGVVCLLLALAMPIVGILGVAFAGFLFWIGKNYVAKAKEMEIEDEQ